MEYDVEVDLTQIPSSYGLASPVVYLDPTNKVHIVHANVHSCNSAVNTPCTPSVAAQPGLATHSSTLKSNFTGTSQLKQSFLSHFSLGKDTYTMIAHGRFYLSSSNNDTVTYKWDLANGVQGVNILTDDYKSDSYLMGGSEPICWRTEMSGGSKVGDAKAMTCPEGTGISIMTPKPEDMAEGEELNVEYKLSVIPANLPPLKESSVVIMNNKHHIPHANIHSCLTSIEGDCTPFVSNTPELSTHSSALKSNFTGTEELEETFRSTFSLSAGSYTMIAHGRFYVSDSQESTKSYKWDVAYGFPGVVVYPVVIGADGDASSIKRTMFIVVPIAILCVLGLTLKLKNANKKVEFLKEEVKKRQWSPEEMMLIKEVMENRNKDTDKELQSVLLNASEVILEEKIGRGAFGEVHRGTHRGTPVAVKTLLEIDSVSVERFRAEILLMKDLKHPYIVLLIGAAWSSELIGMVMEYMQKGAMADSLHSQDGPGGVLSWKDVKLPWSKNIIAGLKYLHSSKFYDESKKMMQECIIHRDLKPDNILIADNMSAKLSDFGESRAVMNDAQQTMTAVGTTFYVAPEIMLGEKYGASADIFSYAITLTAISHIKSKKDKLLQLFSVAWEQSDLNKGGFPTQHAVTDGVISSGLRPKLDDALPASFKELIADCWAREPKARPSVDDIMKRLDGEITSDFQQ